MEYLTSTYVIGLFCGTPVALGLWWLFSDRVTSPWARMMVSSILIGTLIAPTAVVAGHGQTLSTIGPAYAVAAMFAFLGVRDGQFLDHLLYAAIFGLLPIAIVSAAIFTIQAAAYGIFRCVRTAVSFRPPPPINDRIEKRLTE